MLAAHVSSLGVHLVTVGLEVGNGRPLTTLRIPVVLVCPLICPRSAYRRGTREPRHKPP
jgi:hypothetical protein